MNGIKRLNNWDKTHLEWASCMGIDMLVKHYDDIERVAERFCNDDMDTAMFDIFEKGLQAMLDMCDMDDRLAKQDTIMPNIPTGKGGSI